MCLSKIEPGEQETMEVKDTEIAARALSEMLKWGGDGKLPNGWRQNHERPQYRPRSCHSHYSSLQVGRNRNGEDSTLSQMADITHGCHALTKMTSGSCHTVGT